MNTRIVPPHDRPTCQAVSSATPNSSILGLPESITSSASVTTAPSTQPPDTEPRKMPSSSMPRVGPTGPPGPGAGAPGLDHGGERHRAAFLAPVLGGFEDIAVG